MDLTDRQRKFLFAGLVVLLAALGVYLTIGGGDRKDRGAAQRNGTPASTPVAVPSTSVSAVPTGPSPSPGSYDIYSLLPFSRKDFGTAADVARRFVAAYGTYRYDEDPRTYVDHLRGLVTDGLAAQLERDSSAPGLLEQRTKDREVSTSDASLYALRDMQKDQIIFLAVGRRHITKGGVATDTSEKYAVTMTRSGGGWVVYAFQPATVGDK